MEPVANEIATEEWFLILLILMKLVLEGERSQGSKKIWVWVFGTPHTAYYHVDLFRSQNAIKTAFEFREGDKPPPIIITDAYPVYLNLFDIEQFCWIHLLRNSKELEDTSLSGKSSTIN
ncbi:MAG: IS66 family transposase [Candidatus Kariarchaeaceae archaeon]